MDPLRVRAARPSDLRHLAGVESAAGVRFLELFGAAWEPVGGGPAPDGRDRDLRPGFLLVAGDPPVGFAHVLELADSVGLHAHLEQLAVVPERGRRGLGRALVAAAEAEARWAGFDTLSLCTFRDVAWNGPFYRRLGYVPIDPATTPWPVVERLRGHERALGLGAFGVREVLVKQLLGRPVGERRGARLEG